jgi:uncharacterized membrane protein
MSKFVVTTFSSEANAYEGTRALRELHANAELTLYGLAVITKDASGKLSVKEAPDDLPGTAVGSLVGALVGVLGGPAGVVVGMTAGMLLGSISDLLNIGVGTDFLDKVSRDLAPGQAAVRARSMRIGLRRSTHAWRLLVAPSCVSGVPTSRKLKLQRKLLGARRNLRN